MQIDTAWMERQFDRFNKEYFGAGLPRPKYLVNNARTRLGSMTFKWKRTWRKQETYDYAIRLSNYYDVAEIEFQNVLLHEMIHYYIAVNHFKDDSVHGMMFRSIAERINKYGWHIVVRTDTRNWPVAVRNQNRLRRSRMVLAAHTTDGKYFFSVIGPGSIRKVKRQLVFHPQIREVRWLETDDAYFQDFPQCRTLRGRVVKKDLWEEKVSQLEKKNALKEE